MKIKTDIKVYRFDLYFIVSSIELCKVEWMRRNKSLIVALMLVT